MNKFAKKSVWAILLLIAILGLNQQSFAQPEGGGAAILAIEEKPSGGGGKVSGGRAQERSYGSQTMSSSGSRQSKTGQSKKPTANASGKRPAPTTVASSKYDGFIVGDKYSFLNFEIASKVQPIWTLKAKNAGAAGLVQVEVLIDENGNVLTARARTGNALLHPEAEKAALATKFNKPTLYNKPVRAMGFVVYRFGKADEDEEEDE